jgi:penicillin-binding protein 1A
MSDSPTVSSRPWWRSRAATWTLAVVGALLVLLLADLAVLLRRAPSIADLKQAQVSRPSVLLSADGKTLATFRRSQAEPVKLEQVSPYVVQALLATEDRRFYEHHGIDWRRTVGALLHTARGDTQGGSTITQQLARNLFPEDVGHARNIQRKLKEMITALRIERVYTKQQILEHYLNTAPFLYNAVGIEMASRTYFNKPASRLDATEAATLVGMLKGTYYYNPVLYPERAQKRRNLVLAQMVKTGALPAERYDALKDQPVDVTLTPQDEESGPAPHFAAYARRWLLDWASSHDVDLYRDGLVIQSTIDSRLQEAADRAVAREADLLQKVADVEWGEASPPRASSAEAFAALDKRVTPFAHFFDKRPDLLADFLRETPEYKKQRDAGRNDAAALAALKADKTLLQRVREQKTRLQAGLVAMDPDTGEIKAWVGSRSFADDQFDHVAQAARQPGSTFKPFVYGAALESGIGPQHTYLDGPVEVRLDARTVWRPTDMHGYTGQMMTVRDGLVYSKNTITAQLSQDVGIPRIVSLAQAMGVDQSKLDPVPSLALGTSPVTLLEMVDAYCTIAAQGMHRKPVFIRRISSADGDTLAQFSADPQPAMSRDSAVELIDMMRGVVNQGTGTAIKTRFAISADVAGKTGTTQNNTDGWFILMHPHLVAGAWVGFNDQRVTMRSEYWGQGGHNAVLLVGDFFRDAMKARLIDTRAEFPPPPQPQIITTDAAPGSNDESWGQSLSDVLPGEAVNTSGTASAGDASSSPSTGASATVQRATTGNGTVVIGDPAGVAAMQRNPQQPPKSAEEIDRAARAINGNQPSEVLPAPRADPPSSVPPPSVSPSSAPPDDSAGSSPANDPTSPP